MNNLLAGALCLSLLPTPVNAAPSHGLKGIDLVKYCVAKDNVSHAICLGFVSGVLEVGLGVKIICPSVPTSYGTATRVAMRYLADHPIEWGQPAALIVATALSQKYPCKQSEISEPPSIDRSPSENGAI